MANSKLTREELDAAVRSMYRRFAASLADVMAETDTSFEMIDKRVGAVKGWANGKCDILLNGSGEVHLNDISDLFIGCGCVLRFGVERERGNG